MVCVYASHFIAVACNWQFSFSSLKSNRRYVNTIIDFQIVSSNDAKVNQHDAEVANESTVHFSLETEGFRLIGVFNCSVDSFQPSNYRKFTSRCAIDRCETLS